MSGYIDLTAAVLFLAMLGVGLGWWAHPGAGLAAVGGVGLGLVIFVRLLSWLRPRRVNQNEPS